MRPKQDARTLYTISCPCGARTSMDARMFGRPNVCKKCGGSFTVAWGKDPRTKKAVPMAVAMARKRSDATLQVHCACGYRRAVTPAEAAERNRCPGCGRDMIVEKPPVAKGRQASPRPAAPIQAPEAPQNAASTFQLQCACGYKRTVTPQEAAGRNRCPGCGREMVVQKTGPEKRRETEKYVKLDPIIPSRPLHLTPATGVQVVRLPPGTKTFNCLCGERILVLSSSIGAVIQCKICDRQMRVEMKQADPVVPAFGGGRHPTPPPAGSNKADLTCECGQPLELLKALDANGTTCPRCGQTITMEKVRAPLSKHTMIRPRFGPKGGLPPTPPPATNPPVNAAPPPPRPEPAPEMPLAEFEELPEETNFKLARSSFQEVFCPCGEALTVGSDQVGKNIQCPTCFTLMAVEKIRDGNTGSDVLRVRGIGKMDQDTWSLSDFS
jgi:hypothetical protein